MERRFRNNVVYPALKKLKHTVIFPIQQLCVVGDPDFLLCCGGTFVGLELKDEDGKLTKIQEWKLQQIELAGGKSFVARPSNWEWVYKQLEEIDDRVNI